MRSLLLYGFLTGFNFYFYCMDESHKLNLIAAGLSLGVFCRELVNYFGTKEQDE